MHNGKYQCPISEIRTHHKTNCYCFLAAEQEPYKKKKKKSLSLDESTGYSHENGPNITTERSNKYRTCRRADRNGKSNDSPEIPDKRRQTSPASLRGGGGQGGNGGGGGCHKPTPASAVLPRNRLRHLLC